MQKQLIYVVFALIIGVSLFSSCQKENLLEEQETIILEESPKLKTVNTTNIQDDIISNKRRIPNICIGEVSVTITPRSRSTPTTCYTVTFTLTRIWAKANSLDISSNHGNSGYNFIGVANRIGDSNKFEMTVCNNSIPSWVSTGCFYLNYEGESSDQIPEFNPDSNCHNPYCI